MACKYIYENKEYTKEEFYKFVGDNLVEKKSVPKYNKILFPSGNTASKVEGHSTLEEFKKQKEDRLNQLKKELKDFNESIESNDQRWIVQEVGEGDIYYFDTKEDALNFRNNQEFPEEWFYPAQYKDIENANIRKKEDINREIIQLKQELERVDREGFGALKPIYNFYETTVTNVLKKQGYSPKQVTDEYGNTWNEVTLDADRDLSLINFQIKEEPDAAKLPSEVKAKLLRFAEKLGIKIEILEDLLDRRGVNALADIKHMIIQIQNGKEDGALAEEVAHFFVEGLDENSPLYQEMMQIIPYTRIYQEVVRQYREVYGNDTTRLKKEAMGKLIALYTSNRELAEYWAGNPSVFSAIVEWIKRFFANLRRTTKYNAFIESAERILNGDVSELSLRSKQGVYYQINNDQFSTLNNHDLSKETNIQINLNDTLFDYKKYVSGMSKDQQSKVANTNEGLKKYYETVSLTPFALELKDKIKIVGADKITIYTTMDITDALRSRLKTEFGIDKVVQVNSVQLVENDMGEIITIPKLTFAQHIANNKNAFFIDDKTIEFQKLGTTIERSHVYNKRIKYTPEKVKQQKEQFQNYNEELRSRLTAAFKRISQTTLQLEAEKLYSLIVKSPRSLAVKLKEIDKKIAAMTDDELKSIFKDDFGNTNLPTQQAKKAAALLQETEKIDKGILEFISTITLLKEFFDNIAVQANKVDVNSPNFSEAQLEALIFEMFRTIKAGGVFENYADTLLLQMSGVEGTKAAQELVSSLRSSVFLAKEAIKKTSAQVLTKKLGGLLEGYDYNTKEQIKQYEAELASGQIEYTTFLFGKKKKRPMTPSERTAREADLEALKKKKPTAEQIMDVFLGRAAPFNSLTLWVKTLQNSSDPAIASIAKMLEETTQRVKVKSVQETQDFGQEVRDYMKANGITEEMIDQQLLTTETDLVYNPDTNTYDEKERLAFLNPFKNRHILVSKRRKVQELYQEYLKSQETTVGGDPDLKQQYYTEKAEFEKWKRENWYEEFTEEYYKRYDALREEYGDELFEEATGKINEINDQISEVKETLRQGLLNYKDAYSRIKDLNREKAFLRLQVNKDNTPKSEHDKKIAELLGKKVEIDIEIFEYKSNFKKFAKDFNIKMSELGIEEGHRIVLTAELKQAEETGSLAGVVKYVLDNNFDDLYEWLSYNTMRVNTEEFYDERKTITDQIDIVYKKLLAVRGEKESTAIKDLWNDMFPLVKPYRDEEGNILGAEVPDYIQAQVKEINQKIEDIRESLKEGEDEIVTAEEKKIKKELNALFNKLKEIQSKAVTEDYLNEFEAQLNKSGYRQYCIDNDKAYPFSTEDYSRLADNIDFVMYIEKNKETEPELWEWFNRNHYERTIKEKDEGDFFDEYPTYTERLVYTPTYIWTQIKPTRDNFVKIIPGNKYSDRDVKDKFKTEKIEGVTFSSVTNRWLPKSAQFKNQAYFDLAQRNPRLFKLLNMLTDFHLKTQVEGLSDAKLEYFLPSIEKRKLEGNPIINTLNDFLDKNNRFEEGEGNYQQEGEKTKEKKSILTRIREEAEKFAYDNAEEETPRVNQYTKKVEEVRKRVAVPFSRYMSPDQVSRDVVSSLILFRESANHANQMKDALNTTLLFKTILEQEASQTQRVEAVKFLEDTRIFGINKVYEVGETIDNGAAKLRKLYAFGSQSDLTGFFTNIKNNLAGRMQNFLQSEFAGWSDNKAMRKAASYWKNNLFYYLAEAEKPLADRSKDWFIQTYLNPANLKDIIIYSQPGAAKRFGSQYMLSWSKHALEYSISVNALYSHLFHKEVRKGTERKTLYDIIVIKDGRMTIEDGWTDSTGRPIDEEYLIRMKTMLKSILEYVQGKVGSQTKLDTTTIGSAVLFFKSWLIPNIRKRYDKKRANYILDRDVEGYWRTFARLSLRMIINFKSYGELNWATFTEEEKASYRTAAKEMLVMALSTLLISVLFDFDLDDDDKYEKLKQKSFLEQTALLIAIQTKLETESLSAFPLFKTESTSDIYYLGIPPILTEAPKFLTNPIFGLPMLNDTWDIVEYSLKLSVNAEDAYYDKDYPMYNVEKGEAKALHHMLKVIQFDDFIYTWTNPEGRLKLYINMIKR